MGSTCMYLMYFYVGVFTYSNSQYCHMQWSQKESFHPETCFRVMGGGGQLFSAKIRILKFYYQCLRIGYTLKTGTPVEDGDPIFKLLQGVSRPEIQLGVGIHSKLDGN